MPTGPHGLKAEAALIRLLFLVDMKAMDDVPPPPSIGDLYLFKKMMEAVVIMPTDVLPSVLVMLTTKQFKHVSIRAKKLQTSSQVEGFRFCRDISDTASEQDTILD